MINYLLILKKKAPKLMVILNSLKSVMTIYVHYVKKWGNEQIRYRQVN